MNKDLLIGIALVGVFFILGALIYAFGMGIDAGSVTAGTATVTKIPISGSITSTAQGGLFQQVQTSDRIAEKIREADEDSSVDAIFLEINSPGGAPVASNEIVRAVKEAEKPVVSQIREVGASGAYWVASASDYIVSDPVSITGSVGVLSSYLEFSGLLEDYNVSYQEITDGDLKELGSPFRQLQDDERQVLQQKIDLLGEYFLDDVVENRNLTAQQKADVGTAQFYIGLESVDAGLVDELGGEQEAVLWLENQTGKTVRVQDAQFQQGFFASLNQMQGFDSNTLDLLQYVHTTATPTMTLQ